MGSRNIVLRAGDRYIRNMNRYRELFTFHPIAVSVQHLPFSWVALISAVISFVSVVAFVVLTIRIARLNERVLDVQEQVLDVQEGQNFLLKLERHEQDIQAVVHRHQNLALVSSWLSAYLDQIKELVEELNPEHMDRWDVRKIDIMIRDLMKPRVELVVEWLSTEITSDIIRGLTFVNHRVTEIQDHASAIDLYHRPRGDHEESFLTSLGETLGATVKALDKVMEAVGRIARAVSSELENIQTATPKPPEKHQRKWRKRP